MATYYSDYPKELTSAKPTFYRCKHCKLSEQKINGKLKGHLETCKWRMEKELEFQVSYYTFNADYQYG